MPTFDLLRACLARFSTVLLAVGVASAATPDISSSRTHTLAIDRDGVVYAWGADDWGQLGLGRSIYSATPVTIARIPPMASVAAGRNHVLAIDTAGNVWSWGGDGYAQLGRREQANPALPGRVRGITGAIAAAAGEGFSAVLRSDGTVWVWGAVYLVGASETYSPVPRQVSGLTGITKIAAGHAHLLALKSDGTVWGIGSNTFSQLGDGPNKVDPRTSAYRIPGLAAITAIGAGYSQSLAVRSDGAVFAWGDNYPQGTPRTTAQPVAGITDGIAVDANQVSYAVRANGTVVRWDNAYTPVVHGNFTGVREFAVGGAGNTTTYGLAANGTIQSEGGNFVGQRGLGHTAGGSGTDPIPGIADFTHLSAGEYFAVGRRSDGAVLVWGANDQGQLADGSVVSRPVPRKVQGLPAALQSVAAGWRYSLALDSQGRVWAWGNISVGAPGTPAGTPRSTPEPISGLSDVVAMSAGANAALFVTSAGQVHSYGVAGTGAFGSIGVPGSVSGLSSISSVAAGVSTYFAVRSDGVLFAWGYNQRGQLGDGTVSNTERQVPAAVPGISGVTAISTAQDHVLARTSDGRAWTWGGNDYGQLGDGTATLRASPAAVAGLSGVVAVAAGFQHSLALLADGSVRAWGDNTFGQLGDGGTTQRRTPVAVNNLAAVTRISANAVAKSFAVRTGGTAWGWGGYPNGLVPRSALGDGTYALRTQPTIVLREEEGNGNLDGSRWSLDLDGSLPDAVPASAVPKIIPVATVGGAQSSLQLAASINFRAADYGKSVGTFVLGYVPAEFLGQVKLAPAMTPERTQRLRKAGTPILVQLTPQGWSTVSGQLIALTAGVNNANGAANSILDGVDPSKIPGARFCIGYGESAAAMLSSETLKEVLSLEGAASTSAGLPCLLSGVYVSGPPTSRQGSAATFTASVVGLAPSGSVQFKDGTGTVGSVTPVSAANAAVSTAALTTSSLAPGQHAIGADYAGDTANAAASTEFPLAHTVAPAASATSVALAADASSVFGDAVTLTATVTGNNPTGTVQFKDGTTDLGSPAALFNGVAMLSTATLALGKHSLGAAYSGDGANAASWSSELTHTVYAAIGTSIALGASPASPTSAGTAVTFTATVSGTSPTGTVTFRNGAIVLGTVPLANGTASLTVTDLPAGQHFVTADYSGDDNDQAITSEAVFRQVSAVAATPSNPVRLANIATRGPVLTGDSVMIGGFIIGGSAPKKVLVTARGPSMAAQGVSGTLADPFLTLYSGATPIATNDDFGSAVNAGEIPESMRPGNAKEAAILTTLNPGAYTAIVTGVGGTTGIAIVEAFEVDRPESPLVNIATRAPVLTGDNVMIGGFIIQGDAPRTVLITARGPSLAAQGVPGTLANPMLTLYAGATPIASNDDWGSAPNATAIQATGVAPANPLESAILTTLNPGAYTAIVTGAGGTTGIGIVEVFAQ